MTFDSSLSVVRLIMTRLPLTSPAGKALVVLDLRHRGVPVRIGPGACSAFPPVSCHELRSRRMNLQGRGPLSGSRPAFGPRPDLLTCRPVDPDCFSRSSPAPGFSLDGL